MEFQKKMLVKDFLTHISTGVRVFIFDDETEDIYFQGSIKEYFFKSEAHTVDLYLSLVTINDNVLNIRVLKEDDFNKLFESDE